MKSVRINPVKWNRPGFAAIIVYSNDFDELREIVPDEIPMYPDVLNAMIDLKPVDIHFDVREFYRVCESLGATAVVRSYDMRTVTHAIL